MQKIRGTREFTHLLRRARPARGSPLEDPGVVSRGGHASVGIVRIQEAATQSKTGVLDFASNQHGELLHGTSQLQMCTRKGLESFNTPGKKDPVLG